VALALGAYPNGNPFRTRLIPMKGPSKDPTRHHVDYAHPLVYVCDYGSGSGGGFPLVHHKELNGLFDIRSLLPFTANLLVLLAPRPLPERRDSRGVDSVCLVPWQVRLTCFSLLVFCHHHCRTSRRTGFVKFLFWAFIPRESGGDQVFQRISMEGE